MVVYMHNMHKRMEHVSECDVMLTSLSTMFVLNEVTRKSKVIGQPIKPFVHIYMNPLAICEPVRESRV